MPKIYKRYKIVPKSEEKKSKKIQKKSEKNPKKNS